MRNARITSWIKIANYEVRHDGIIRVEYHNLSRVACNDVVNLNVVSFDIECMGRPNVFPTAEYDPIIQISAVTRNERVLFALDTCDPIEGKLLFFVPLCLALTLQVYRSPCIFLRNRARVVGWMDFVFERN